MKSLEPYKPKNKIRVLTAASLFDGHDAAINIMRRIIQSTGAEVIHLGHNRSVQDLVDCAMQEDVQAIALTSYQGGHTEYFKYLRDLLLEKGCGHVKIFGGGGGVILPDEIAELHAYGISRIYSPDDGRALGLQGMINDLMEKSDFPTGLGAEDALEKLSKFDARSIAVLISAVENEVEGWDELRRKLQDEADKSSAPVLGITGTGGAGKSSVVDELVRRFTSDFPNKNLAIISVDPTKRRSGGALLGDRIRMNAISTPSVYMRSLATRNANASLSAHVQDAIAICKAAGADLVIVESSGIGQSDTEIVDVSDTSLYVMTPEYGAATQLEKIDMIDFADVIAINKFDKRGAEDSLRDVKKQYKRSRELWEASDEQLPVVGTIASQFNDPGMNKLYRCIFEALASKANTKFGEFSERNEGSSAKIYIIPPSRVRYLSEISETIRTYNRNVDLERARADRLQALETAVGEVSGTAADELSAAANRARGELHGESIEMLEGWDKLCERYRADEYVYQVRDQEIRVPTHTLSLSKQRIPKICTPRYSSWGDRLRWLRQENVPGAFPFTAGVFPFKRSGEDPTRMFAGEGGPERTNRRFHYVSAGLPAKRLSTAFDSVTLYGEDPHERPDIYGKIGNSGVSVCCLDDAKKLYSGFDLCNPKTSVSMTINGPAAIVAAFFMNAAIDQQCERYLEEEGKLAEAEEYRRKKYEQAGLPVPCYSGELPQGNDGLGLKLLGVSGDEVLPSEQYERIKADTLRQVRGTVQADILKEDQAQNTCIFSSEFSLKLMGDVQEYFVNNKVRNFYSVSISGYHIAEAGANPITQLAFTLSNGFTFVEYYLSRGMHIDEFAPNLSFFFSNGIDPEYAVIGRVARRIWSKAIKGKYGGNERSQKLKYHIQTSGRSLHAQEISFNDIRTTLQALYAIYDNCNSLHTNAYDEAITTPTEESVRRAMAIQLIINHELGLAKNENPLQGSFIIEELTDLVEEAVLAEFDRLTERGGVLGAMETMYQRGKIQEESLYYENLKHSGELPVIGVNTFLSSEGSPTVLPREVIRATEDEKLFQINTVQNLHEANKGRAASLLGSLKGAATTNSNIFASLMEAVKGCTLGQITHALYEVGGQYRRNM